MSFNIQHRDSSSSARAGEIITDHGVIRTPIFMPVGTQGTVKTIHQAELKDKINAEIILGNTYHLYLRPGIEIINKAGGLHKFIGWDRPMLTDSGGYQIFSLSHRRKITEKGALFYSHIDGSKHLFTPESAIDIQRAIGADIIMAFDECTPYPCEYNYAKKSMNLTHRWLDRCLSHHKEAQPLYNYTQTLAPIVQGSVYPDLRKISAEYIASKGADINAIGGLSVGEPKEDMYGMTELVCSILPQDKPRYLMGVGTPADILTAIGLGIDMFDCVLPTRNARHGLIYTSHGILNIKNKRWSEDFTPIDDGINCDTSLHHTKAYLRHLFMAKEQLGAQISSLQNIHFYLWLVREAREQIMLNTFAEWKTAIIPQLMQRL